MVKRDVFAAKEVSDEEATDDVSKGVIEKVVLVVFRVKGDA
jgi:hypothetical protein